MDSILSVFNNFTLNDLDVFLSNPDNWTTIGYVGGGSFIFLVLLGVTNTITVYRDVPDFLWSLALVLVPISTFFALALLMPEETPDGYNLFWENTNQRIISICGGLFTALAILKTFINCISNNGVIFGPIMFVFKICAAIVCVLVCLGIFNKLFEKDRSIKNVLIAMIIFGVFSFFVNRLINGERVALKKAS